MDCDSDPELGGGDGGVRDSELGGGGGVRDSELGGGVGVGEKAGERSGVLLSNDPSPVLMDCDDDPLLGGGGGVGEKAGERSGTLPSDDSPPIPMDCVGDSKLRGGQLVSSFSPPDATVRRTAGSEMAPVPCRIVDLTDDLIGKIMSFLGTDEGARFALYCSKWRYVWRSTPLVMDDHLFAAGCSVRLLLQYISGVVANHPGPVHRLSFSRLPLTTLTRALGDWVAQPIFNGLRELVLNFPGQRRRLPRAMLCLECVHTLHLTNCIVPSRDTHTVPFLKDLRLVGVVITGSTLQAILSSARYLQTLVLSLNRGYASLHINLPNLESLLLSMDRDCGNGDDEQLQNIFVAGASKLARFLIDHESSAPTIRIRGASSLRVLGRFGREIPSLQLEKNMFKSMVPCTLVNVFSSIKILSLKVERQDLPNVLKFLDTVTRLEILHIHLKSSSSEDEGSSSEDEASSSKDLSHDSSPPDCIQSTLKLIVFWSYIGSLDDSKLARYFIENAQFVKVFSFQTCQIHSASWLESQRSKLNFDGKISGTARLEFAIEGPSAPTIDQLIHAPDPFSLMLGDPYHVLKGMGSEQTEKAAELQDLEVRAELDRRVREEGKTFIKSSGRGTQERLAEGRKKGGLSPTTQSGNDRAES